MFAEMLLGGLVFNSVILTELIDGHCKQGEMRLSMELYREMMRRNIKPDLITLNSLTNAFCKTRDTIIQRKESIE